MNVPPEVLENLRIHRRLKEVLAAAGFELLGTSTSSDAPGVIELRIKAAS